MKKYTGTKYKKVFTIIDKTSGEVITQGSDQVRRKIDIENGYIMFFYTGLQIFSNLWKTDQVLYYELCFQYGYYDSFAITATFKEKMCEHIGVGVSSLTKSISRLVESKLLLRIGSRGEYRINIMYSYMGVLKERENILVANKQI